MLHKKDLTKQNLMDRISICDSLLKRNENDSFLKRIITGDKKWIVYINVERKRSSGKRYEPPLTALKASLHPKKVMLCIWWDWNRVLRISSIQSDNKFGQILFPN